MSADQESGGFETETKARPGRAFPLRPFLVICVFLAAAGLFSAHFENVFDRLRRERSVSDAAHLLSHEELKLAVDVSRVLRESTGQNLRIATFETQVTVPKLDAKTIYIGISRDSAVVKLSPLAAKALGDQAAGYLEKEHFGPYLAEGRPGDGLRRALKLLWDGLVGQKDENDS